MSTPKRAIAKTRLVLGSRSYDIQIGSGAIHQIGKWLPKRSKRAFIIADESLAGARAATQSSLRAAGWECTEFAVPAGEKLKDFATIYPLYGKLLEAGANRDSMIFALGGGTVGDAVGFVAATYLRGVPWVGIPTTLLAQVDSAVGGKTGINHELGKNLIGAVYQPDLVVCDTDFLRTLPERDCVSGLAEVIKCAIIFDPQFYAFVKENMEALLALDARVLTPAIKLAVGWKCKVVSKDEFDRTGAREVLNFGHTFAHALESQTHYGTFRHGEAVIWGMRFALALSLVRRKLSAARRTEIDSLLAKFNVPPLDRNFPVGEAFDRMAHDKKVRDGKIHFVLLNNIGKTVSDAAVTRADLDAAFALLKGSN